MAQYASSLGDAAHGLEERVRLWRDYEATYERILRWMGEAEASLRDFCSRNSLQQKQEQLDKYQLVFASRHALVVEFCSIADKLEQNLICSMNQHQGDLEQLTNDSCDLMGSVVDSRISVNMQQVTSRFKAMQQTAKDLLKKCESGVKDHKAYNEKYNQCVSWLTSAQDKLARCIELPPDRNGLDKRLENSTELLKEKQTALALLNTTVELGEKLYASTGDEGTEVIRGQLEDLQQAYDALFDSASTLERDLNNKIGRWSCYEEAAEDLKKWIKETQKKIPNYIELKTTLDEKRAQLQTYRVLLHDISAKQQALIDLRDKSENLPEKSDRVESFLASLAGQHEDMHEKIQSYLERYEAIVSDHQQYSKSVLETQEWLEATHNTVEMWGQSNSEHISLRANLDKLKNLQKSLPDEEPRITQVRGLGEKVLPGTVESGQSNIRAQIDATQQDWQALVSAVASTIDALETTLANWTNFEAVKDVMQAWLRNVDNKLHAINLRATLEEKKETLNELKEIQGEVRAKELEIDQLSEKAQSLNGDNLNGRSFQVKELTLAYQQLSNRVKDMCNKWQQYVGHHADYDSRVAECQNWLHDIKKKLTYCSDMTSTTEKELEKKLKTIQELLMCKEEGFTKVQSTVELAQLVLANTAPPGHDAINCVVEKLQQEWTAVAAKMVETKTYLDDTINRWTGFLTNINQLKSSIEHVESALSDVSQFQSNLSEKRAQLERLKGLEEKLRCEKYEVEGLKVKASEMQATEKQGQVAVQAQNVLRQFEVLSGRITTLRAERETQYRDHRHYKDAHDDLLSFINRTRDKIPALRQRNLSDKLSIETSAHAMETLLSRQAQGQILLDQLYHRGEVLLHSTSSSGQESYKKEMQSLKEGFEELFKDIAEQKDALQQTVLKWREYKEEYERLSDWLQKTDADMKAYKTMLYTTIGEKTDQVNKVKVVCLTSLACMCLQEVLQTLEENQSQLTHLQELSETLTKTHLDTFVRNQMSHITSRYQLLLTLAKDVVKKVESTFDQHKQFEVAMDTATEWMDNVHTVVQDCSSIPGDASKETLERHLEMLQALLGKQEEGQNLVSAAVGWGEKVLRNTRADGRNEINERIEALQADWDKLVRKMSSTKVSLETNLLEWTDMNASYSNMQQWISEREAHLHQLSSEMASVARRGSGPSQRVSSLSIGERKAKLRRTTCIVQDIVAFEPVIESVTAKATDSSGGQVQSGACEISSAYHNLTRQAKELLTLQQQMLTQHQDFVDAGNDFMHWLRSAKDRMAKCAEATGDKDTISGKATVLKMLQNEQEDGQDKLDKAFHLAEKACSLADEEDREVIEEEVAFLQDEFDKFLTQVGKTKNLLEMGIVKWTEYEDKFKECEVWVAAMETRVQGYNKLQNTAEEKRILLEEFQAHLQAIFDWQKTLDLLNIRAQLLLETCADSRVSNAVTQLTTKYNTLLSHAKEVMRRLEIHFQEHQQHNQLYAECADWIETTKAKLEECDTGTSNISELQDNLATVKSIKNSLEQGQHKLRYVLELKERVILNTEQEGARKILQNTENMRQQFEQLISDIYGQQQEISALLSKSAETEKMCQDVMEWMEEIEVKALEQGVLFSDLSEKRGALEKYRIIIRDIAVHRDMIDRLASKKLEDDASQCAVDTCISRYESLKSQVAKNIKILEGYVRHHEAYYQAYMDATEWLRKMSLDLQQTSDCHGEKEQVLDHQAKQLQLQEKLLAGEPIITKAVSLNKNLMDTTSEDGKDNLRTEAENLKQEWLGLQNSNNDNLRTFGKCLQAWQDFQTSYDELHSWLQDFQQKIETEPKEPTPEDLEQWKGLLEEATQKKALMESLCERCETLMVYCAYRPVRDQTLGLQTRHCSVLAQLQSLIAVAHKTLSDHTEFVEAQEEFDAWLSRRHGTVASCQQHNGTETELREKLETLQGVATRASEGLHLLAVVGDAYSRAASQAPPELQEKLRAEYTRLRDSYDRLKISVSSAITKLKHDLSRWSEFAESKSRLESCLGELEDALFETPDSKGEVSEMRTLLERYRHTQQQIKSKDRELKRLLKDTKEFSENSNDTSYEEEMTALEQKWFNLNDRCVEVIEGLETEIKEAVEYQAALQEVEKWLLQVSFQLMSENSMSIRSREHTEELIHQHDKELENIREFQQVLDRVKNKAHKQINKYIGSVETIQETYEHQIHNLQESYDSLLRTALQIQKRLAESLAKFEEYEATLDNITANLDEWEPIIVEETNTPVQTIEDAKYQLEMARVKLVKERSTLAAAVQACEATVSRSGSPSTVLGDSGRELLQGEPGRELLVRAKLQDLTEQIQVRITSISSTVTELEDLSKQNEDIKKWIEDNQHLIHELRLKPVKLRHEAQANEMAQLNDLRSKIIEKQNILDDLEVKQMTLTPDTDDDDVRCQMNSLEEEVNDIIDTRSEIIGCIEEYRTKLRGVYSWFDTIIKLLEKCDKVDYPDSKRRNDEVQKLWSKFREANVKVEELTEKANEIKPKLSSLDNQQVDEQLRSVQKKYSDLKKRVGKKKQVIEMTRKGYEEAKQNVNDLAEWFVEKTEYFDGLPMLGHSSKNVELRINDINDLQKEIANKNAVISQIEKTLENIKGDVEGSEVRELEDRIKEIQSKQEELNARTDEVKSSLVSAYDERQTFEDNLQQINLWMKGKESEVACPSLLPLRAEAAEKVCERYKKLNSDVQLFYETNFASTKRYAESLLKECDEEDAYELNEIITEFSDKFSDLKQTLSDTLSCILNLVEVRKDFEKKIDACNKWNIEAEGALQVDTRSLNTAEVLEEHLKKLEKLDDEQGEASARVNSVGNMCTDLMDYLTDADKFSLGEIVSKLQDRSEQISNNLPAKIEQIREAICTQKKMTERMVESTQTLANIQKEARGLSRPVGRTVMDGQNLLLAYQAVMRKVSEFRRSLEQMRKCPDITMEEMRELIRQQQELMSILEKQITRIRQLILVRQQYASLVSDISTFISRYTIILGDIETSEMTVADKLKKLRAVIIKIQECEGQLTSAQDKGAIIGEEGHVEDRNAIMEELQILKSGVSNLRREVENKQQEHETTAESHKKLQVELNTAMEWLFEQESELKSRPLLTLEVESAEDEIETHNNLSSDIEGQLEKVKEVLTAAKKESGLPHILQERIAEANMVLSTYPLELKSRLKYLTDAKMLRIDYEDFSTRIAEWVSNAKSRLQTHDGVDFENLSSELEDHNSFFSSEKLIGESLQQLGQTAERIVPSLGSDEQEELTVELQDLTKDLDEVTTAAKKCRLTMEKNLAEFYEYKAALDKCKALVHSASSNLSMEDTATSITSLRSALQRVDEERQRLYDQGSVINDFTDKANAVIAKANEACQTAVGLELVDVSRSWKVALDKIESRREKLRLVIEQWQRFELSVRSLDAGLTALEQRVKELEGDSTPGRSKEELDELLEELEEEVEDLEEEVEGVGEAAVPVVEYLRPATAAAAAVKKTKETLARRRLL
ncbi:hypothetical protein HAZT_HAZT011047 [Hyalella azteca]|uniref:KASH domain-containing protein n=1 Tax=Hyalella azteca TaxID=294128 RepID=A0A6A0H7Q5_HYAAZ|nr:hypothetical protein HAZT_HAZT011047 [Hyalella azteca]